MEDVKVVMCRNGHHIISKINELYPAQGDSEPICFLLTAPLVITYKTTDDSELELSFTLWSPFSKSVEFRIPFDYVVSIGDPKDDILEKYMEIAGPLFERLETLNQEEQEEQ